MNSLVFITLLAMVAAAALGIFGFYKFDLAVRVLVLLNLFSFFQETIALILAKLYHDNLSFYVATAPIEYFLFCLYFNYSINKFAKHSIGWYFGGIGIVFAIINIIFGQGLHVVSNSFVLLEGAVCIALGLFALYRVMLSEEEDWWLSIHLWLAALITVYWCSSFILQSMQNIIVVNREQMRLIRKIIVSICLAFYFGQCTIFIFFRSRPKHG